MRSENESAEWAFTGTTAEGVCVRVAGEDYSPRVFLDGVEVAVTGRAQVLRDGGTRRIPTERGMLTLPHHVGDPDRTPRLRESSVMPVLWTSIVVSELVDAQAELQTALGIYRMGRERRDFDPYVESRMQASLAMQHALLDYLGHPMVQPAQMPEDWTPA